MEIHKLLRPHLLGLQAYSSARHEFKKRADIYLDANENNFGNLIFEGDFVRYPEADPEPLKQKLVEKMAPQLESKHIFLGHGSDEALDLLFRAFVEPGEDAVATIAPSYGMYSVLAQVHNARLKTIALDDDFQLSVPQLKEQWKNIEGSKLLFLCSPNNPSGNCIHKETILYLLANFKGILIIDEAYIDFANSSSMVDEIRRYANLVVVRTFSKAHALAGLRLGWAAANPDIIQVLNKIKLPYNLNSEVLSSLSDYLSVYSQKALNIEQIRKERAGLESKLALINGVKRVFSSEANFVLFQCQDSRELYTYLIENGIVVRDRHKDYPSTLRVTVGLEKENQTFLDAVSQFYKRKEEN